MKHRCIKVRVSKHLTSEELLKQLSSIYKKPATPRTNAGCCGVRLPPPGLGTPLQGQQFPTRLIYPKSHGAPSVCLHRSTLLKQFHSMCQLRLCSPSYSKPSMSTVAASSQNRLQLPSHNFGFPQQLLRLTLLMKTTPSFKTQCPGRST